LGIFRIVCTWVVQRWFWFAITKSSFFWFYS